MRTFVLMIPDMMTIFRFAATPIFAVLLYQSINSKSTKLFILTFIFFVLICISDFFDGKIARKIKKTTSRGAFMDISADFVFIIVSYLILVVNGLMPIWFVVVVVLKFLEFLITSVFLKKFIYVKERFFFDYLGRTAAVMFYILPGICLLLCKFNEAGKAWIEKLLIFVLILVVSSFLERLVRCFKVYNKGLAKYQKRF